MPKPLILGLFSLLISFELLAQPEAEVIASQIQEAQAITKQWMHRKSECLKKKDLFKGQAERADYIISGIPNHVVEMNPNNVVFRHYIGKAMPIVLETAN